MSDSQLYTPDEEESGSTSSSGYDPAFDPHAKVQNFNCQEMFTNKLVTVFFIEF